jgi:hypothetical protein
VRKYLKSNIILPFYNLPKTNNGNQLAVLPKIYKKLCDMEESIGPLDTDTAVSIAYAAL